MGGVDTDRYALGRLILDYLRIFIWPAIALAVVVLYKDDVREILRSREVELAGVFKIGQQVMQIEERAQEEIADIRVLLDAQREQAGADVEPVAADIESKLESLTRNINRDFTQIQQAAPTAALLPSTAPPVAASLESVPIELARAGFQALIDLDVEEAIKKFDGAYKLYPDLHNVAEIRQYLRERKARLTDPNSPAWADLYRTILSRYSWGLPKDLRPKIRQLATESYSK